MGEDMYKNLLKQWIMNVQENDFNRYLKMNDLWKSESEARILYQLLKEDWEGIYDGKEETFLKIKSQISEDTYQKLYALYEMAKKKYHI